MLNINEYLINKNTKEKTPDSRYLLITVIDDYPGQNVYFEVVTIKERPNSRTCIVYSNIFNEERKLFSKNDTDINTYDYFSSGVLGGYKHHFSLYNSLEGHKLLFDYYFGVTHYRNYPVKYSKKEIKALSDELVGKIKRAVN